MRVPQVVYVVPPIVRRALLTARLALAICLAACSKTSPQPQAPPVNLAMTPVQSAEIAGVKDYKLAFETEDLDERLRLLEVAVRANPRLTEAWYELGRLKVKRAPIVIKANELQAVAMFREGLEAEQEALRLLDSGKIAVWTGDEEIQARETLATDLANANEVMADQDSLLNALRMRTY
ncbi:MAG TPA: hypothetical protein VML56_04025 [Burkholderiales bacterium]|nr:hypothetical protein [Burkholderiales bacterium]